MNRKILLLLTVITLIICFAAGCAKSSGGASAGPEPPAPTEAEVTPALTAAAPVPYECSIIDLGSLPATLPGTDYSVEANTGNKPETFPYTVKTESSVWYIAADDLDNFGADAMFEGLARLLRYQESDFAEARNVLQGYIFEEIPSINIYTDLSGNAQVSGIASAYYNNLHNTIKIFHDWDSACSSLLHEYVHYLTIKCSDNPIVLAAFSEGIAQYVSLSLCRNDMARSVNYGMPAQNLTVLRDRGVSFADGVPDMAEIAFGNAFIYSANLNLNSSYVNVCATEMNRKDYFAPDCPELNDLSYDEAYSIMLYIAAIYGRDTLFSGMSCSEDSFPTAFGLSYPELYTAWKYWNLTECLRHGLDIPDPLCIAPTDIPEEIAGAIAKVDFLDVIVSAGTQGRCSDPGRYYTYYDKDGHVIFDQYDTCFGEASGQLYEPYSDTVCRYDSSLYEEPDHTDDPRYTYTYDDQGRVTSVSYNGEGSGSYNTYTYYDNGLVHVHYCFCLPDDEYYTYYYDDMGRTLRIDHEIAPYPAQDPGRFLSDVTVYEYYSDGETPDAEYFYEFPEAEIITAGFEEVGLTGYLEQLSEQQIMQSRLQYVITRSLCDDGAVETVRTDSDGRIVSDVKMLTFDYEQFSEYFARK